MSHCLIKMISICKNVPAENLCALDFSEALYYLELCLQNQSATYLRGRESSLVYYKVVHLGIFLKAKQIILSGLLCPFYRAVTS